MSQMKSDYRQLVDGNDELSKGGRIERLKLLMSCENEDGFYCPHLCHEYYQEARLCWFCGAFVATIIMVQLSFEELIRSHYRVGCGTNGRLSTEKKVDDAGFYELINETESDGYITEQEAKSLNQLRKDLRNPYVHVKDTSLDTSGKPDMSKPNFLIQSLKITAPELIGFDVVKEAEAAIRLLVILLPRISNRTGGL
jgi:hypothetical protein